MAQEIRTTAKKFIGLPKSIPNKMMVLLIGDYENMIEKDILKIKEQNERRINKNKVQYVNKEERAEKMQ